jgi:ABC-type uncharacterized transport system permease subunit
MGLVAELLGPEFWASAVRLAAPLLLAALGGILSERSGVITIGLEGLMLIGALAGVLGAYFLGSAWLGVLCAVLAGAAAASIHATVAVVLKADQIVSGAALNIGALGLTAFLVRVIFGLQDQKREVPHFVPVAVPGLVDLPWIGPVLFRQGALVYLAFLLVPLLWWVLYRTTWGLRILAAGEHPRAADTAGIGVDRVRAACVILCGVAAGLGGAFLSLGQLHFFVDDMVGGRGFIALAALIFGRWNPLGAMLACLVFGAADALQFRMQAFGVGLPHQLLLMFPYLATLGVLALLAGQARPPSALGVPYRPLEH